MVIPKAQFKFTIPGLTYTPNGGFPSQVIPECKWGLWDEFLYDNAKANLSAIVSDRLSEIVRCTTNAGPVSNAENRIVYDSIPFKKYEGITFYLMVFPTKENDAAEFYIWPEKNKLLSNIPKNLKCPNNC